MYHAPDGQSFLLIRHSAFTLVSRRRLARTSHAKVELDDESKRIVGGDRIGRVCLFVLPSFGNAGLLTEFHHTLTRSRPVEPVFLMAYSVAVVFKMNGHGEKLGVLELRTEAVLVSMWRCAVSLLAAKVGRERMFIMKS